MSTDVPANTTLCRAPNVVLKRGSDITEGTKGLFTSPVKQHMNEGLKGPNNSFGKVQPPNRPGHGSRGREIALMAKYFLIQMPDCITVHHYDVTIVPEKLSKPLHRQASMNSNFNSKTSICAIVYNYLLSYI